MNNSPSDVVEECEIDYDSLKQTPIMISRSKQPKVFTSYPCLDLETNEESDIYYNIKVTMFIYILENLFRRCLKKAMFSFYLKCYVSESLALKTPN